MGLPGRESLRRLPQRQNPMQLLAISGRLMQSLSDSNTGAAEASTTQFSGKTCRNSFQTIIADGSSVLTITLSADSWLPSANWKI